MNRRLLLLSALALSLSTFSAFGTDHNGRDAQRRDLVTGNDAVLRFHDNGDGTFSETVYIANTLTITGALTDTQLRASAVPVAAAQKQFTGVPSTFTIGTTDATVFTLAAGEIGFIQNLDDAALAVKKGASASTSSLSFILAPGTAADDGKGGAVTITDWVGAVSVAAMTGSPRYIAWKQAP